MSKLSKFLLQHGTLIADCPTNSSYYRIANTKVRVSNHLPGSENLNDLIIFIPQNSKKQYIVALTGKLFVYNSFTSLRVFLENWALVAEVLEARNTFRNNSFKKMEARMLSLQIQIGQSKQTISELSTKLISTQNKQTKGVQPVQGTVLVLDNFTVSQRKVIAAFVKQNN